MKANSKEKLVRKAKGLTISIMVLGAATVAWIFVDYLLYFTSGGEHDKIVWIEGHECWQIFIVATYLVLVALLFALCVLFLMRINKNISKGIPFPNNNVPVIIAAGIIAPFVDSLYATLHSVFAGEFLNRISSNGILVMLLLFLFAILYKFASLASEDSNLAI